jgi:hypothetical protein
MVRSGCLGMCVSVCLGVLCVRPCLYSQNTWAEGGGGGLLLRGGLLIRIWPLMGGGPAEYMFVTPHIKYNSKQVLVWKGSWVWGCVVPRSMCVNGCV